MEKRRFFAETGIGAMVLLAGRKGAKDFLEIAEQGVLAVPPEVKPNGFYLVLAVPSEARIVIAQKNVGQDKGGYHRHALAKLGGGSEDGFVTWIMHDPIIVVRQGQNVWTSWQSTKPNRVDCWYLEKNGHLDLFQIGIITHDDGKTFRLLGEHRWRGQIFKSLDGELVARPDSPVWGSLLWREGESRQGIRQHPDFQHFLTTAKIEPWTGAPEEIDPPLDSVPGGDYARINWYIPFAGQTGQGIAILRNGSSAWVHGIDILDPPDPDGIKRLWRNDLVKFKAVHYNWGAQENKPPKLIGVKKVVLP